MPKSSNFLLIRTFLNITSVRLDCMLESVHGRVEYRN